jgi:undecaprenyl-diphosphatase
VPLASWGDERLSRWIVAHRVGVLDHLFAALSRAGTASLIWVALALALALMTRRPLVLTTVVVCYLADVLAYAIKLGVDRPRPGLEPLVRLPTDPSFPSGHAATSFAGATMLSAFAPRYRVVFFTLATAIAFSRIYVGVHWPFDVVAGAALGAALGYAAVTSLRWRARLPPRSPRPTRRG